MIDLSFELEGDRIPLDYGYALFSALTRVVPRLHGDLRVGVHPIRGVRQEPRVLTLVTASRLRLRLPPRTLSRTSAWPGRSSTWRASAYGSESPAWSRSFPRHRWPHGLSRSKARRTSIPSARQSGASWPRSRSP